MGTRYKFVLRSSSPDAYHPAAHDIHNSGQLGDQPVGPIGSLCPEQFKWQNSLFGEGTFFSKLCAKPPLSTFNGRSASRPLDNRTPWLRIDAKPPVGPIDKKTTTSRPLYNRPVSRRPDYRYDDWNHRKPPVIKPEPPPVLSGSQSSSSTNLQNFIWLALGGFAVLVLIAIFMKIGKPIRRARRQQPSARPAPARATNISMHPDRDDDGDSDMGSRTRLTASTDPVDLDIDLPPPYSECLRSSKTCVHEDAPPPYSAFSSISYTTIKDCEPQVHIHRPKPCEDTNLGIKAHLITTGQLS